MTTEREISRRDFLGAAGVMGAALVLPLHLPGLGAPARRTAAGAFTPNAWIRIDADGAVALTTDKSEMGQGVLTALRMILADELEAPWDRVRIAPVPEDPAAWSRMMITGGSSSTRTSYDVLRQAGAAGRAMLVSAAAQEWGVPESGCRAEQGEVIHRASGRRLPYGKLVARASTLPVPEHPPLKPSSEFRYIGTPMKRLDPEDKVTGRAQFGIDVKVPGMLIASIQRAPMLGGAVKRYDAARAKGVPGVRHVVALPEIPGTGGGFLPPRTAAGIAVVADTYWQAVTGRNALDIEWDAGPNASLDSAAIAARFADLATKPGATAKRTGDADAAIAGAATRVDAVYDVPYLAHATMEPMNCTAWVRDGQCDVWAPTQGQTGAQGTAAQYAGVPKEKVRIHTTFLGGGFGRRAESDFVAEAVQLSKAVGRPVKVIWSREDDMQHDVYRPAVHNRLRAGLDAQGKLVGWHHHIVAQSILARFGPLKDGVDGTLSDGTVDDFPYAIPAVLVEQSIADLPVPVGFWRSVGASHNAFVVESFIDELAAAAKQDPLAFRRALMVDDRHRAVLDTAARGAGWGTPLPAGRARGIAIAASFGSIVAEVAEVSVTNGTPRVHRVVCAVDCGPVVNPAIVEAQMRSAVVYGLTAALYGEITIAKGGVEQGNFPNYPMLHMDAMPVVDVHIIPSTAKMGGIGEPGTPPIAPAVGNAIFAATGTRLRKLPIGAVA